MSVRRHLPPIRGTYRPEAVAWAENIIRRHFGTPPSKSVSVEPAKRCERCWNQSFRSGDAQRTHKGDGSHCFTKTMTPVPNGTKLSCLSLLQQGLLQGGSGLFHQGVLFGAALPHARLGAAGA